MTLLASASITVVERHRIVRDRTFHVTRPTLSLIHDIIQSLMDEKMTGKVTINVSQGSLTNVQCEESSKIS